MSARRYTLASAYFQAARRLEGCGPGHPSARLHGHGFRARLRAHLPEGWGGCPGGEPEALVARLRATLAPLDYRCLNELLAEPDDAGVARWLWPRLDLAGLDSLGLDSTPWQGVELDASGQVRVWRRYRFEAAHRLPYVPPGHPCGRLHGHGFEVILHAALDSDTPGCPYDALDARWAPLHSELHQACLNDLPGLDNPTSERLAAWLWQQLEPEWAALGGVTVLETASAGCHYDGAHYRIWKEQSFESAVRLVQAPAGDRRRCLHGHSYRVRLHLTAPLDAVLGWTIDYGEVKALFQPLYARLDHQRLDELEGLAQAASGTLAEWIRARLAAALPALDRIDLWETPERGVSLCWGGPAPVVPG